MDTNSNAVVLPELEEITQLNPSVVRILGNNPGHFTLQGTNSYLIGNGSERILIDTSEPNKPHYVNSLKNFLQKTNSSITDIIVSHYHIDHMGSVEDVQKMCVSLRGKEPKVHKFPTKSTRVTVKLIDTQPLINGQLFKIGDSTLQVISTPGHTDDHAAFLLVEEKILFTADCILGHGSAFFENLSDYLTTLDNLVARCEEFDVLYPGHGEIIQNPCEKINEYISHRKSRIDHAFNILKSNPTGLSFEDIFIQSYENIPEEKKRAASFMLQQALNYLILKESIYKTTVEDIDKYYYKT